VSILSYVGVAVLSYHLTTCYFIQSAWCQHLKLKCDELLSSFAFNCNLRRYTLLPYFATKCVKKVLVSAPVKVGRCRLTLSNPC